MDIKSLERLELNKILQACAEYATLEKTKLYLKECLPADYDEAKVRLSTTAECDKLLYTYGVGNIEYFEDSTDLLVRAEKGSTLSCGELLIVNALQRSARIAYNSVMKIADDSIIRMKLFANKLYFDKNLEDDITTQIISSDEISDYASEKLYSIRSRKKALNERIRSKLNEYMAGSHSEYLQDNIVTMRGDRYVVPVKAEHKSHVKGFIHDRSQSGATFFIEPEYVLELNNELIALSIDEREEIERILKALSRRVGKMSAQLAVDQDILIEMDSYFARAQYGFAHQCMQPQLNKKGYINIIKGRHPLIEKDQVVPVSIELGEEYNFLLLSGANTGGKTVTLKMCGLFCLMSACGIFIPAAMGSSVAIFNNVFCDIGDSQSIEESLSTFSSHITNIIHICNHVDSNSLVLIDELGGGTNPDEGQALARSVVEELINAGSRGIITTHFTQLKEFAYTQEGIENASMEFDATTLRPLYRIKIGLPGSSNALAISRRLGLSSVILERAISYLSEGNRNFENIVRKAEESRIEAEEERKKAEILANEWQRKMTEVNKKIDEVNREKEKVQVLAKTESRRIIAERTQRAEEILFEIEEIFKKEEISQSDLIRARTLKNQLKDSVYTEETRPQKVSDYQEATWQNVQVGILVYVKRLESEGQVISINKMKGEMEIACGSIKTHCKLKDVLVIGKVITQPKQVKLTHKNVASKQPMLEINILGCTVQEALFEVDNFIDRAVLDNLEEIKVIHGVGTGKLKNAIAQHLKRHKNVESYRLGKYGEGETGVTIITLK